MDKAMRIARQEIVMQLRSRGLLISVAAIALIVIALVALPRLIQGDDSYRVELAGETSEPLGQTWQALAEESDLDLDVEVVQDAAGAEERAEDDEIDAAVIDGSRVVSASDLPTELAQLLQAGHQSLTLSEQLSDFGLTDEQLSQLSQTPALTFDVADDSDPYRSARQGLAFILTMSFLFLFMSTTVSLASGIVEEKSSRIVEILLVALKPWQLLSGKLAAFGVIGLLQLLVMGVAGFGTAYAIGLDGDLPPGTWGIAGAAVGCFVLGYAFFAAMAAALGSLVSRQEETNSTLTPVTVTIVLSYLGAYLASDNPDSTLSSVLTVLPPVSSISLPVQLAAGQASTGQVLLAVALMVLAVVAMVALAARIYERSVLRFGPKVGLRQALLAKDEELAR